MIAFMSIRYVARYCMGESGLFLLSTSKAYLKVEHVLDLAMYSMGSFCPVRRER